MRKCQNGPLVLKSVRASFHLSLSSFFLTSPERSREFLTSDYIFLNIYKKRAVAMFDYIYNPIEKLSIREIPYLLRLQRVKERGSSS